MALLGAAYRFSSDRDENAIGSIQSGTARLSTQEPIASDGDPTKARWLIVPDVQLAPGDMEADADRHGKVVRWLYRELLDSVADRIRSLPPRLGLGICLWVSGGLPRHECVASWQECWQERQFRPMCIMEEAEPTGLETLDDWLDQVADSGGRDARLIVSIQLHRVLSDTPPVGAAEAGVALLLMPGEQAKQRGVVAEVNLHRPVHGPFEQANGALSHALRWGDVTAAEVPGGWQTGLSATQASVLREVAVRLGLSVQPTDLDQTVGHAGPTAPWLAIACAAAALSADVQSQIVFAGQPHGVDVAVVRRQAGKREARSGS
ncbi:hypothetical protein [Cupriavidus necator]